MKGVDKILPEKLRQIKMVCFDSDGVLVEKGTKISDKHGRLVLETHLPTKEILQKLQKLQEKYWLVIASGRSLIYLTRIYESVLSSRVALIAENGIFGLWQGQVRQFYRFSEDNLQTLKEIKRELGELITQEKNLLAFEPKQFLLSLHARRFIPTVCDIVQHHRRESELSCLWNEEAFDISFRWLTKAFGMQKLTAALKIQGRQVLAVGNDSNDWELAKWAGISVSTDPTRDTKAEFATKKHLEKGGLEIIDKLLST